MDKEIDKITKNPETDIVIRIDDYMGKKGLTIREFIKSERYTGFTKAGTRIPIEHFSKFKEAINSIDEKELMKDLPVGEGQGTLSGKKPFGQKGRTSSAASESDDIQEEAM